MIKAFYLFLKLVLIWKSYMWLPAFRKDKKEKAKISIPDDKVIDVMFLMVDHYEPAKKDGDKAPGKVHEWCRKYMEIAGQHVDSDGVHPQHSWFYRYDFPRFENITALSKYVYNGFGEIEFHLHHGNDTSETFTKKIRDGVEWFNKTGAMISAEENPQKRFAYIAGNWALDNGRKNDEFSGVNNEIEILSKLGCYSDFTFPAFGTNAQPHMINTIYYATDTPEPKSYDYGIDLEVGKNESGDLMIFQGPLFVDWEKAFMDSAAFESFEGYAPERIDCWRRAHVHVKGRPEWIFIKLHTHGMQSTKTVLSEQFSKMCSDLEERFKNAKYRLHYVTAREAFNIAKAAEANKSGNAGQYRNFLIKEPVNKKIYCDTAFLLKSYSSSKIEIFIEDSKQHTNILFKESPVLSIHGFISDIEIEYSGTELKNLKINGNGECEILYRDSSYQPDHGSPKVTLPLIS